MLKLLRYLKPHKNFALFTLFLAAINNVLTLGFPLLLSEIINEGINKGDLESIKSDGIIMLVCCFIAMLVSVANSYCSSKVSTSFAGELRADIFNKVESFSQGDIDKIGIPSLITRTINDIRQVQDFILMSLRTIISVPIMLIGGTVMAVIMDPGLSLVLLIVLPVIAVIALLVAKKILPFFDKIQKRVDKLNLIIREKISGIRVIRAFNRTKHEDKRFKDANDDLTGMVVTVQRIFASLIPIVTLLAFLLIIILVAIGYVQINRLTDPVEIQNTIGDLQAFIIYLVFVVIALTNAAAMFIMLPRAKISANRINDVLELQPEMEILPKEDNNSEKGVIEFRNVSFKYKNPDGEYTDVLKDVSFTANPGKVTAIIGGTGSGKSTILNLIPRFYEITDGSIKIDGIDIKDVTLKSLRENIGIVQQDVYLFSGTVRENIEYGRPGATEEEIREAARLAGAEEFIDNLPNGFDTYVGERGVKLSGGQKQRISIARVFLKNPKILILDEATSALDNESEFLVQKSLERLSQGRTTITVAHRLTTIKNADKILVVTKDGIAESGTHEELTAKDGIYSSMYTMYRI